MGGVLEGKNIAVTGAGRGIGRSVALAAAAAGANVVAADLGVAMDGSDPRSDVAEAVAKEIADLGGSCIPLAVDVTTMEGGASIVNAAVEEWGSIDGVVCVAGILRERMLFNMSEEEFDAVVNVHLKGHFTVIRAAAEKMREQRSGAIIGFTSGACQGSIAQANYSAAKGGIVSLVRSAAAGLRKYGVTANCIAPVAKTRMSDNVPMDIEMGEPEDVAQMTTFLMSDAAKQVTGQIYTVVANRIAVWNQPREVRSVFREGGWTPETIAASLDSTVGQERMPLFDLMDEWARKAAAKKKAEQDAAQG